jgi:hypothetical protein
MKKPSRIPWYYFALGALLLGVLLFVFFLSNASKQTPELGITYSTVYAQELGLDPIETYRQIVDELEVKLVRLPVYWSQVQLEEGGESQWETVDQLLEISEEHEVQVVLAIGQKVPRWPECHIPDWVEEKSEHERYRLLLSYLTELVTRYRDSEAIVRWQVENEPFFPFGECPEVNTDYLLQEIKTVRALDNRPIQMTVSGELEPWLGSAGQADVLGVSLYRVTWNDFYGYFIYPFTPAFYSLRAWGAEFFVESVIISELQAEPWFFEGIDTRSPEEWSEVFTPAMLEENIQFAKETGLDEVYLWGVEWWYYLRAHGVSALWETAKNYF